MTSITLPAWFRKVVAQGVQKILALRPQGTPPEETFTLTIAAWAEALWFSKKWKEKDMDDLALAFQAAIGTIEYWPTPAQILKQLPKTPCPIHRLALPAPPLTKAQRKQAHNTIALVKKLLTAATLPSRKKKQLQEDTQDQEEKEKMLLEDAKRRFAGLANAEKLCDSSDSQYASDSRGYSGDYPKEHS